MPNTVHINQIAERVERLLVRHEELQRTNALLNAQVDSLSQERDSLKSRLGAARARVDALLDRLPHPDGEPGQNGNTAGPSSHPHSPKTSGSNKAT
jgi:cell division protein ZapB